MSQHKGSKGPAERHPVEKPVTEHKSPTHLRNLVSQSKRRKLAAGQKPVGPMP